MEKHIKEVYNCILEFEKYVELTDRAFKEQYNISVSPFKALREKMIPKMGTLNYGGEEIRFQFHGAGCKFNFPALVIDYDYGSSPDFRYEGFDSWKLYQFILSQQKYEKLKDESVFNALINEMESSEIIKRVNPLFHTFKLMKGYYK